jgi:hypothetical protein
VVVMDWNWVATEGFLAMVEVAQNETVDEAN